MNHFEDSSLPGTLGDIFEERNATIGNSNYFISGNDLLSDPIEIDYLINAVIETGTTGQLFGPPGTGKTFIALSMAFAIATGTEWNGHKVKKGIVLYLIGEGQQGIKRRVAAWGESHGDHDLSFFRVSRMTFAMDEEGSNIVIDQGKTLSDDLGVPVALIVIDTLARHFVGDENATRDMGLFVRAVDTLRDAFPGASILIVHHTGKNPDSKDSARGSSALKAAMDFEIRCDNGKLTFTKMKDAELPDAIAFKLSPVVIGVDAEGKEITSCIVTQEDRSIAKQHTQVSGMERLALQALINTCVNEKRALDGKFYGSLGGWRKEFYRLRKLENPSVEDSAMKVSFQRACGKEEHQGLKGKGFVSFAGSGVLPLRDEDQKRIAAGIVKDDSSGTGNIDGTFGEHVSESEAE